jgi:hypothetical protein
MRCPYLLDKLSSSTAAWEQTLSEPALRREILAMAEVDQAARKAPIPDGFEDKAKLDEMAAIDRKNTARMKDAIR